YLQSHAGAASRQPWVGALVLLLVLAAPFLYARAGYGTQGVFLLFGAAFGVIFQRSRFCLVRAFREPFLTGDGEHTRAAALARLLAGQTGLLQKLGAAVFLPSALGWGGAIGLIVAVAVGWAMLATWNEETRRFSAI